MATAAKPSEGILGDDQTAKRDEIVELLKKAYWMEIETVMSYIANSVNPDGVRAQEIKESLETDITEELGHLPQPGEQATIDGVDVEVERVAHNAVVSMLARPASSDSEVTSDA